MKGLIRCIHRGKEMQYNLRLEAKTHPCPKMQKQLKQLADDMEPEIKNAERKIKNKEN